jgi:hypothetical protein
MQILGCEVINTCGACPEQYDVTFNGKQLGYLRLRWGHFRAEYPDVTGEVVYEAFYGDDMCGVFYNDEDRTNSLTKAVQALLNKLTENLRDAYIPEDEGI